MNYKYLPIKEQKEYLAQRAIAKSIAKYLRLTGKKELTVTGYLNPNSENKPMLHGAEKVTRIEEIKPPNMLRKNEVRIGNWYIKKGIAPGWIRDGEDIDFLTEDDLPLQITPIILIKTGFSFDSVSYYKEAIDGKYIRLFQAGDSWITSFNGHNILVIEYVHQLQNTFFFITNEELNVQL